MPPDSGSMQPMAQDLAKLLEEQKEFMADGIFFTLTDIRKVNFEQRMPIAASNCLV